MDISFLKPHLGELYTQVETALKDVEGLSVIRTDDGSWVPKSRMDEEQGKLRDSKAAVATLTRQLEEAKKAGESVATLQATVEALKQQVSERDTTITGMKRSGKIQEALRKARVRDAAVVERLLDASKIGEDDKGNLTGLDDQVKALREKSAYLFEDEGGRRAGFGGGKSPDSGNGGGSAAGNGEINAAIRAAAGRSVE